MNNKILNFVIAISLFGIVVAITRDYFFADHTAQTTQIVVPTQVPILSSTASPVTQSSSLIACNNSYFTFDKGAKWRYQLLFPTKTYMVTSVITATSEGRIQLTSQFDNDTTPIKTTVECRADGIYGIPFPIFQAKEFKDAVAQYKSIIKVNPNILFLPTDDIIAQNKDWETHIKINIGLPISLPMLNPTLKNKIVHTNPVIVNTTGDVGGIGQMIGQESKNTIVQIAKYTLEKKKGITDATLNIALDKSNKSATIKLLQFTP